MDNKVTVEAISKFLDKPYLGSNFEIIKPTSLNNVTDASICFSKSPELPNVQAKQVLILISQEVAKIAQAIQENNQKVSYIPVSNPRLAFAKVVTNFFIINPKAGICKTSVVHPSAVIHPSVTIGSFCVIGKNVKIGKNTVFNNSVVIGENTVIGENCYFKSGSIIGEDGFGFDFEEDKTPVRIPHMGRVIIKNNVEIGSKCTIPRGTLDDTIISDHVKIDDQVHLAHNCQVGKNTLITACAEISGSTKIGENCWLAPNCTIMNKLSIGNNVVVGIGALIISDLPDNTKHMGLEALELKKIRNYKKTTGYGDKH